MFRVANLFWPEGIEQLVPPRGHARAWGKGRSRAAYKRRHQRNLLKARRAFGKMAFHASLYGMNPARLLREIER